MFKEIPISKTAKPKKLLFKVALNDAEYKVISIIDGKKYRCPFYASWHGMLTRCYSKGFQERNVTYKGCSVDKEWLTFSSFKKWMKTKDWKNKQLDKDILYPNNKIYSSEKCLFVDQRINLLFNYHANRRGGQPIGVTFSNGKYRAFCNFNGKRKCLGLYKNASKASRSYYVRGIAYTYINNSELYRALLTHANLILKGEIK